MSVDEKVENQGADMLNEALNPKSAVLEVYDPAEALSRAEEMFPPARQEQIAQFLEVEVNHPAFLPFLAISAAYGLNPTMGEIWLIPQKIREKVNGSWQTTGMRYKPSVGRDGLLKVARRDPSFIGVKTDVVCANDTFRVQHNTVDPMAPPEITHVYAAKQADKDPRRSRGTVIGAWAVLYLRNRPPVYYFADAAEHAKTKSLDGGGKTWDGAWSYTSAMITKSAVSYVLRIGIGVSGLLPADEMQLPSLQEVKQGGELPASTADGREIPEGAEKDPFLAIEATLDAETAEALRGKLKDMSAAEVEMTLAGLDEDAIRELAGVPGPADAEVVDETSDRAQPEAGEEREDAGHEGSATPPGGSPPEAADPVIPLRERLERLTADLPDAGTPEEEAELRAEINQIEEELARIGGENPEQEAML